MKFRAEINLTPDDAVDAYYMHVRYPRDAQKVFVAGALLVAIGFGIVAYRLALPVAGFLGIAFAVIAVTTLPFLEWRIRRTARNEKREKLSILVTEDGMRMWDSVEDYRHPWEMVTEARLDDRGVLIYLGPERYLFLPARSWVDGYRRDDLRALFQRVIREPNQPPQTTPVSAPR